MSMDWYCLTLDAGEIAAGRADQCREAFEKAFAAASGPRTMALFKRELDGGAVELFFTPECAPHAADLIERFGAAPCERPSLIGLHLVVGHHEMAYYMP